MRINKWLAEHTSLSRRKADEAVATGRVTINGRVARVQDAVLPDDTLALDDKQITPKQHTRELCALNKPVGYVCSRRGQQSPTIYSLLPPRLHFLNPIGRLDKDSSGLLLLTNDGELANKLSHPSYAKQKVYQVLIDKPLTPDDQAKIMAGVQLEDGRSALTLNKRQPDGHSWLVTMQEGRNRQIRRTFAALGYRVIGLHRTRFGTYELRNLPPGKYQQLIMKSTA